MILLDITDDFGNTIKVHSLEHSVYMQRYNYFRNFLDYWESL